MQINSQKTIIAIGGGEIRAKETLEIDRYIAQKAKLRAGEARATALFLGTASHDSMPYFNSFRKTYTSVFDIKAEVALLVYGEMDYDKIKEKFLKCDMIYVGGGDTKFMLDFWRQKGIVELLRDAYNRGVILSGLSAGGICWFDDVYSDCDIIRGESGEYKVFKGLGFLRGIACPHYNLRPEFSSVAKDFDLGYALENNCALEFTDGAAPKKIGEGGGYVFRGADRQEIKEVQE